MRGTRAASPPAREIMRRSLGGDLENPNIWSPSKGEPGDLGGSFGGG